MTILFMAGCGGNAAMPTAGPSPSPPTPVTTASAYILPGAVSMGDRAFGDEPIVIYKGERLRWVNVDTLPHVIVADSPDATDFRQTEELPGNGEQSFIMTKLGTTRIHCAIHPTMTGTLIVREQ
jgi:plastocyanin